MAEEEKVGGMTKEERAEAARRLIEKLGGKVPEKTPPPANPPKPSGQGQGQGS